MILKRISGPTVEPVSLATARSHLRVTSTSQDTRIESLITVARGRLERNLGRAFVDQTWELKTDGFCDEIFIPRPPLIEVSSVKYIDEDGVEQTLDTDVYLVIDQGEMPSSIVRAEDQVWPDLYSRPDAVRIRFRAGYSYDEDASPAEAVDVNVPEEIRQAILLLVGLYFETREEVVLTPVRQELQPLPSGVEQLIEHLRVPRL